MRETFEAPQKREVKKERFEFELTVNGNIICQRYFRINNFKEQSFYSLEFVDAVEESVNLIKESLVEKSKIYMDHMAPRIFKSEEELRNYIYNADGTINQRHADGIGFGRHIIVKGNPGHDYVWADKLVDEGPRKPEDFNEFVDKDNEQDVVFKFAVIDNGPKLNKRREVASTIWDGSQYPRFVRNGVDLSNGRGKYDNFDLSRASHEMSLYYWCNVGQPDLVPIIIRNFCEACSLNGKDAYTTEMEYGDTVYNNLPEYPTENVEYPYKKN